MSGENWQADANERAPVRVNPVLTHPVERRRSLDGGWSFRLDPQDEGVRHGWFDGPARLIERVTVPGCWQGQGFGHDGEDYIWDFRMRARTFRATYKGTAWYGKTFRAPARRKDDRLWVNFGGVHPSAEVWLNGTRLGAHSAPFVPFGFDVTDLVCGGENFLAVRVHEACRWLGLSLNWQGNWSGLYRGVELTTTGPAWIERLWLRPDVRSGVLRVLGEVRGAGGSMTLSVAATPPGGKRAATGEAALAGPGEFALDIPVRSPRLWSPDEPNLYRVDAALRSGGRALDAQSERAGFVELSTKGKHFLINGETYYMRGSGDFNVNPETASPDTDRDRWRRKLRTLRQYGYNYVRCQSYVPAPEYFDVADEVGLIVQGEMGMLGAWGSNCAEHSYAWPQPRAEYRDALKWQWDRTVMRDVNHPSANIYCMSNELGGTSHYPRTAWQCYRDTKAIKPTAFIIWTDGGYEPSLPADFVNAEASLDKKCKLPLIQHEFRWWTSYPDVRKKKLYTGAVRPYEIELLEGAAQERGLGRLLPLIADNTQRLQYVESRGKMDACRRDNPTMAGICHFTAMEIGLAPQGIVDAFYGRKYADAATWRRTNGDTVLLVDRDFDDRVLVAGGELRCKLLVSDFSHPPFGKPLVEWTLRRGRKVIAQGALKFRHVPFRTAPAGTVRARLPRLARAAKLTLAATLREGGRTVRNEWDFWLFPERVRLPAGVCIYGAATATWLKGMRGPRRLRAGQRPDRRAKVVLTEAFDETLADWVREGGRCLIAATEGLVRPFMPKLGLGTGRYFFTPPANYPPYENANAGTIIARHPMLGDFPHEGFADLQLYRLIAESPPLDLDGLGAARKDPVIRSLNTFHLCGALGYLAEFRLGKGGVIVSALGLDQKLPEARYLLAQVLTHAAGGRFRPKDALPRIGLEHLLAAGRLGLV